LPKLVSEASNRGTDSSQPGASFDSSLDEAGLVCRGL
jgi:hypothetical protein